MGTNSISSVVDGDTIFAADNNSLRSAMLQNWVPRATSGIATTLAGALGTAGLKWSNVFSALFTVGSTGSIEFSEDSAELVLKLGGIEKMRVTSDHLLPVGMIVPYSLSTAPSQWIICDGSAVSRTTYDRLYTAIGDTYGSGDTATTFNVPDFRGKFLRGHDAAAGNDPEAGTRTAMNTGGNTGDNIGSIQDDLVRNHAHNITVFEGNAGTYTAGFPADGNGTANQLSTLGTGTFMGAETRPVNAYTSFIIKT